MDSITHTVLGACLGEAIAGKQLGKKAMLLGALTNNIPDLDVIGRLWMQPVEALLAHRGVTHSIAFVLLFSPALALLFKKLFSGSPLSQKKWLLLSASGLGLHIFFDASTSYGTGWLEPFHHARISFNSLFIIDPLFSLPLLIGTIALLVIRNNPARRIKWAKISMAITGIYFITASMNKLYVNRVVERNIFVQRIACDDYMATPTPFNSLLWYVVVRNENENYTGYYSLFDKNPLISFHRFSRNDSILLTCNTKETQDFIRFSKGYYCVQLKNDSVVISDMRFGQKGGWYQKDAPFILNFYALQGYCSNLQQGRFDAVGSQSVYTLVKRIKGRQ